MGRREEDVRKSIPCGYIFILCPSQLKWTRRPGRRRRWKEGGYGDGSLIFDEVTQPTITQRMNRCGNCYWPDSRNLIDYYMILDSREYEGRTNTSLMDGSLDGRMSCGLLSAEGDDVHKMNTKFCRCHQTFYYSVYFRKNFIWSGNGVPYRRPK